MTGKKIVFLLLVIFFGVVLNVYPRINYSFPFHADEYVHYQYSNNLSAGAILYFGQSFKNLEIGFHYILATLNSFGIPYLVMFRFFPSLFIIFLFLSVFILARKMFGFKSALYSVLFLALLKSSVNLLGPVFFVPMSIGMIFIPIILFLIKKNNSSWVLLLSSVFIIHPPSSLAILLLINIEFFLLRANYLKNVFLQFFSFLIASPLYYNIFSSKGMLALENLNYNIILTPVSIFEFIGIFNIAVILLGIYASIVYKKNYSICLYIISLLSFIFVFFNYKIEIFIPYARSLMYLFVIFSITFGLGIDYLVSYFKNQKIRNIVLISLIIIFLIINLPKKIESHDNYYKILNTQDYNNFLIIKNITFKDQTAIIDPWLAISFTPIAERKVFSRIVPWSSEFYNEKNNKVYSFFNNSCDNLGFLKENNITIIYGSCNNSHLVSINSKIHLFPGLEDKKSRL